MSGWDDPPNGGGSGGDSWGSVGAAAVSNDKFGETNAYGGADAGTDTIGGNGGSGGGCFNCGEEGHMKNECPNPRKGGQNSGLCYNCGEAGHNKSDCTNAAIPREFTGTCRGCGKEGHRIGDCPDAGPVNCKNCEEEGHKTIQCKNPRKIDRSHIPDILAEIAWKEVEVASAERDLDNIQEALDKYLKSLPDITYAQLEKSFRSLKLNVYIIALERELAPTYTNMNLQGVLDQKYTVSFRLSPNPKRPKEADGWPNPEENLARLEDAGIPVDRLVPLCGNCSTLGHVARNCPDEKQEPSNRTEVKCFNCDEVGHRIRDCPQVRPDRFACRNCKATGHSSKECPEPRSAEGVECKKCNEIGHFSRDCPTGGGGGYQCRNCRQEGHKASDCVNPPICQNCDEEGHVSRECSKPRDYSRVKCSNCQEMGHTKVRCKQPLKEEADEAIGIGNKGEADYGGGAASGGGEYDGGFGADNSAAEATSGGWNAPAPVQDTSGW